MPAQIRQLGRAGRCLACGQPRWRDRIRLHSRIGMIPIARPVSLCRLRSASAVPAGAGGGHLWSGLAGGPVPFQVRMKAPNSATPALSARARPSTFPVTAGLAFAHVRAARALVKKLM